MRKLIAIFFLFLFVMSATEAGQLLKLPALVDHYLTHKVRDNISFAEFVKLHYVDGHANDGDENQENRMPFKETNSNFLSLTFIESESIEAPVRFNGTLQHKAIPLDLEYDDLHHSVFHPPRLG